MKNSFICNNKSIKKIGTKRRISLVTIFTIAIMAIIHVSVYAANYSVNVNFDGKNIEMTSENPKMEWSVRILYIGEPTETTVVINSIGNKEVEVEFKPEIIEGTELGEILNLKIINNKTNEVAYDGKYSEFQSVKTKIPAKETTSFRVIVEKTSIDDKDIQSGNCKIKFKIIASGEKSVIVHSEQNDNKTTKNNDQTNTEENTTIENQIEKITTEEIKPIKKEEAYIMYFALAVMIMVLIILVIQFLKTKK